MGIFGRKECMDNIALTILIIGSYIGIFIVGITAGSFIDKLRMRVKELENYFDDINL